MNTERIREKSDGIHVRKGQLSFQHKGGFSIHHQRGKEHRCGKSRLLFMPMFSFNLPRTCTALPLTTFPPPRV